MPRTKQNCMREILNTEDRVISKVSDKPHVINPLTVAYNKADKPRLVLDCRHVNPHLYQFKFKYEDSSVARQMFDKGDQLFSYDLKSAYHHIISQGTKHIQ